MQAMILAAGLGTRLRPYSLYRPKPLFPLLGRPILLCLLNQLHGQGFNRTIVNAHYLREQFVELLRGKSGLHLQLEERILGTGGGLRQALPQLGSGPVLVLNGDTLFGADLRKLRERHLASGAKISLVVHDHTRFNNLRVLPDGTIDAFRVGAESVSVTKGERLLAFTGVHFLDSTILRDIPAGCFCDIVDHYINLLTRRVRINALEVKDHFWADLGTPADYLTIHADLLRSRLDPVPDFLPSVSSPISIAVGARISSSARLEEWAMIGADAQIGDGAIIRRSVVWDGAVVAAGSKVEDQIVVA